MLNHRLHQNMTTTLCMEVFYPYHSHLIGRAGGTINQVMQATSTKIHFPDQNRMAGQRKSNRVDIRGKPADIEQARHLIRRAVPVEFMVECSDEAIGKLGKQSLVTHFSKSYDVLLRIYPRIDGFSSQVNIRGSSDRIERLNEAVNHFFRITHTHLDSVMMKLETSFDHLWLVKDHVTKITKETGAGIRCPDISNGNDLPRRYSIWIRGSMSSVYTASLMLNGYMPLQLTFQTAVVPDEEIKHLARKKDVILNVERPASDSSTELMTIRTSTYEKNAGNLYELRRMCLRLPQTAAITPILEPAWNALEDSRCTFYAAVRRLANNDFTKAPTQAVELFRSSPTPAPASSGGEQWIPASLSAARFDANSFRHLAQLLQTLGLSHYTDLFLENEIDLALFTTLTDENFLSIGITAFGARKIMTSAIKELTR